VPGLTLADIVENLVYKPDWQLCIEDRHGTLYLGVITTTYDAYHPERGLTYHTHHRFLIPPDPGQAGNWRRWVFDRLGDVDDHERMESFVLYGERPYAPDHSRKDGRVYRVIEPDD
jgi:hypothetical protein